MLYEAVIIACLYGQCVTFKNSDGPFEKETCEVALMEGINEGVPNLFRDKGLPRPNTIQGSCIEEAKKEISV